jgi:sugar phosphate isomerase/epimerase
MDRREFLSISAMAAGSALAQQPANVKLGVDLFSLRGQNWTPIQYLDYCAKRGVKVVHFSEIRFIGSLDPQNLRAVRAHAEEVGIEVEIGMTSICPSSTMFKKELGTAEEQVSRMIDAAKIVGSKIVRSVLGGADDRKTGPIAMHIENTVRVLKNSRSKAQDNGIHIAIENHAGDMQGWELKTLIEEAGKDFVGACLDSGNPLWTLEDPHVTLETLHPYVLTSHVRDSMVWSTPDGAAVAWVPMGRGNVDIASYVRRYAQLCPGKALSMETIVFGPRPLPYKKREFWDAYRDIPAWNFERFVQIAEKGKPYPDEPWTTPDEARRERDALDESLAYTKKILASL